MNALESSRAAKPYVVFLGLPVGAAQVFAALLLVAFVSECLWIAVRTPLRPNEMAQIEQGQLWLAHRGAEADVHSVLVPLLASIGEIGNTPSVSATNNGIFRPLPRSWRWRARLPFILIGLLLGCSLWYVARRLFGNAGGFIALTFYAFAPPLLQRSATVQPTIIAAWGAFGVIFTSIAVAHTLYAPREVVLWNWKRILLLAVAIALSVVTEPALIVVVIVALAYLLYLVPERRRESLIIFAAACAGALLLIFVLCRFRASEVGLLFSRFGWHEFSPELLVRSLTWTLLGIFFLRVPSVLLLFAASLIAFAAWKRPRYFGPVSALIVWAVLMLAGITLPHLGGYDLFLVALPFAFVFIAGVFSDLLETQYGPLVFGVVSGILLAHAIFSVLGLARF